MVLVNPFGQKAKTNKMMTDATPVSLSSTDPVTTTLAISNPIAITVKMMRITRLLLARYTI
ncbi:hypothetical protein LSAJ18_180049 [Latilactobacillus sakei]|nr:hypothetical protein LSAJ18_180049 [Latilactobacillus sakei]